MSRYARASTARSEVIHGGSIIVRHLNQFGLGSDRPRGRRVAIAALWLARTITALSAVLCVGVAPLVSAQSLTLVFFDVGQGDATLIYTPEGRTALIDAGPSGPRIVDLLRKRGVDTLDLVIATHNHADHIGGMTAVLQAFPVRNYMDNGVPHSTATYARTMQLVEQLGLRYLRAEPRTITIGSAHLQVLPRPHAATDQNEQSIGVLLEFANFRALLPGDASVSEQLLWRQRGLVPELNLFKLSHHGSDRSFDAHLFFTTKPRIAVVSVGGENAYGHPSRRVLDLVKRTGATVYRTDELGSLEFVVDIAVNGGAVVYRAPPTSLVDSSGAERGAKAPPGQVQCCRVCTVGKPCGNSCIARAAVCRKTPGCACGGGIE